MGLPVALTAICEVGMFESVIDVLGIIVLAYVAIVVGFIMIRGFSLKTLP